MPEWSVVFLCFLCQRLPWNISTILFLFWPTYICDKYCILSNIWGCCFGNPIHYSMKGMCWACLVILPLWLVLVQYWQVVGLLHCGFWPLFVFGDHSPDQNVSNGFRLLNMTITCLLVNGLEALYLSIIGQYLEIISLFVEYLYCMWWLTLVGVFRGESNWMFQSILSALHYDVTEITLYKKMKICFYFSFD